MKVDEVGDNNNPKYIDHQKIDDKNKRVNTYARHYSEDLENEKVLKKIRVHWIAQIPAIFIFSLVIGFCISLLIYHDQFAEYLNLSTESWLTMVITFFALGLAIISRAIIRWLYNYYILTTCRLIHFRISRRFHYEAEEIMLDRIKHVDVKRPSLLALIFNYGDLELGVDLNNEMSSFKLKWIRAPHRLMHKVNEAIVE